MLNQSKFTQLIQLCFAYCFVVVRCFRLAGAGFFFVSLGFLFVFFFQVGSFVPADGCLSKSINP